MPAPSARLRAPILGCRFDQRFQILQLFRSQQIREPGQPIRDEGTRPAAAPHDLPPGRLADELDANGHEPLANKVPQDAALCVAQFIGVGLVSGSEGA